MVSDGYQTTDDLRGLLTALRLANDSSGDKNAVRNVSKLLPSLQLLLAQYTKHLSDRRGRVFLSQIKKLGVNCLMAYIFLRKIK